jgi:hypothetical protein
VTGRFFTRLGDLSRPPTGSEVWGESVVQLNHESDGLYRDVFTGRLIRARRGDAGVELSLAQVFTHLPVALLKRVRK